MHGTSSMTGLSNQILCSRCHDHVPCVGVGAKYTYGILSKKLYIKCLVISNERFCHITVVS